MGAKITERWKCFAFILRQKWDSIRFKWRVRKYTAWIKSGWSTFFERINLKSWCVNNINKSYKYSRWFSLESCFKIVFSLIRKEKYKGAVGHIIKLIKSTRKQ